MITAADFIEQARESPNDGHVTALLGIASAALA